MNGKKGYRIELKIKESNGEHLVLTDHYKNITPEAAVILLTRKYVNKKGKKGLMHKLDAIYNELVNDIEKALEIR
jgi:hypothetical protein